MSQVDAVLSHLKSHNGITSMQAFALYGCTRLSDKIFRLRNKGYVIESVPHEIVNRYGDKTTYVEYRLVKESDDEIKNN